MELHETVMKLVGEVRPVGETNEDNRRFENLKVLTELIDRLVFTVSGVAVNFNRVEFSIKRAGKHAKEFLRETSLALEDFREEE